MPSNKRPKEECASLCARSVVPRRSLHSCSRCACHQLSALSLNCSITTDRYPSNLRPLISARLPLTWGCVDSVDKIGQDQKLVWPQNNPFQGEILKLDGGKLVFRPLGLVFVQHALIGRRTCVMRAELFDGDKKKYIVKRAKAFNDEWVLNHLPCVLHHETFETDGTDGTNIQYQLADYFKSTQIDGKSSEYERRNLQVLDMTELFPIKDLTTADTLIPVIKGVFNGYKYLHEEAGVLHRDISENNLMYWKDAKEVTYGVLSDYDLSLLLDQQDQGPWSKQRTGTRPFMSLDLLEPTPRKHLYRHDLESLFYAIIVLMFRSQGERFEKFPALESWFTLGHADLLNEKKAWYLSELPQVALEFERLYPLAIKMSQMFRDGYLARLDHANKINLGDSATPTAFEEPTLGGHVDFDKFQAILDSV